MNQSNNLREPTPRNEWRHLSQNNTDWSGQLVEKILDKIAGNQIGDALKLFKQKDESLALLLEYYWKRIEHERGNGLITRDEANHETNDLVYRLLSALEREI